jgi:hypothetical protein
MGQHLNDVKKLITKTHSQATSQITAREKQNQQMMGCVE